MKPLAGVLAEPGNGRGVVADEFDGVAVNFGRWGFNPGVLGLMVAPCLGVFIIDACFGPKVTNKYEIKFRYMYYTKIISLPRVSHRVVVSALHSG